MTMNSSKTAKWIFPFKKFSMLRVKNEQKNCKSTDLPNSPFTIYRQKLYLLAGFFAALKELGTALITFFINFNLARPQTESRTVIR